MVFMRRGALHTFCGGHPPARTIVFGTFGKTAILAIIIKMSSGILYRSNPVTLRLTPLHVPSEINAHGTAFRTTGRGNAPCIGSKLFIALPQALLYYRFILRCNNMILDHPAV
jgi:hypothetical protein